MEALAALERWETEQPQALMAVAFEIVPLLGPYLLEINDHGSGVDDIAAEGNKTLFPSLRPFAVSHMHDEPR